MERDRIPAPGAVKTVTSLANPTIKDIRGLALSKNRKESGLFVAEGLRLVADALERDWPIRFLVHAINVASQPGVSRVAAQAHARGAEVLSVSEAVLGKIARRDNPQMVIGVFEQKLAPIDLVRAENKTLWVALEGIKDPGNLGTIIRTSDAVGAAGVMLIGDTVDPFSVEAVRATMGSIFHLPLVRLSQEAFLAWRKGWRGAVVGTHLKGNEQSGLPEHIADACDELALIPMAGKADSLNLAVATGVMLFEIRRKHLALGAHG
jgi:TrmH family RNA methyltransferase